MEQCVVRRPSLYRNVHPDLAVGLVIAVAQESLDQVDWSMPLAAVLQQTDEWL